MIQRFSCVRDELTFRASDNETAPEGPILSFIEKKKKIKRKIKNHNSKQVMDELTSSASDNEDAPESPTGLL